MFNQHYEEPMDFYQDLAAFRFNWIEQYLEADEFSIERILGYTIQLMLVLKSVELNQEKGQQVIDTMIKESL